MDIDRGDDVLLNEFTDNLNELCLKTPEQKKILKTANTQTRTANKVTFEPEPGTFNITFDTSESESDDDLDLNAIVNKTTTAPALPEKPLTGVTVFVDVRAENENRSKAISRELERLGATICEKISSNITHVVFKDGRNGTLSQLKKFPHIRTVSVLWVDACKTIGCKVNEGLYPARHHDANNDSVLPAKVKRVKSLQPKTFEEDVNNSAKKEDRKRKRMKKLNKDYGTPTDQVICLDSQEFIKSSDLHKLVATPLAIPDTPWIINYINGTENESTATSPDALCTKLGFDDSKTEDPMNQDVQCKLDFEDAPSKPEKQNSVSIDIGSSPTKSLPRTPKMRKSSATISKKEHSRKTSERYTPVTSKLVANREDKENTKDMTSTSNFVPKKTKQTKSSTSKAIKSKSRTKSDCHGQKNEDVGVKNTEKINAFIPSIQTEKSGNHKIDESDGGGEQVLEHNRLEHEPGKRQHAMEMGTLSPWKRSSSNKVVVDEEDSSEILLNGQRKKKKKKLMSKTQFLVPQEKLISPALKGPPAKESNGPVKGKKKQQLAQNNSTSRPNTFTMLQNLESSKKAATHENVSIISSSKQSRNIDNVDISKVYTSFIEDNVLPTKEKQKLISSSPAAPIIPEEPKVERRRSKRLTTLRRSSIDFKVTKKFRKLKTEASHSSLHDHVPKEFSLTDDAPMDLNLSFVHDENEGLICTSQNSGTIIRIDDLPTDAIRIPGNDDENAGENEVSLRENDHLPKENIEDLRENEDEPREIETTAGEIDSGISDSEEINDDEVFPPLDEEPEVIQSPPPAKKTTRKSNTGTKTKRKIVSPRKKTSISNRSINTTSTSNRSINTTSNQSMNRTLNGSSTSKKFKHSIVCTSLHFSEQDFAKGVVKHLKEYQLKKNVAPDTSHVITGSDRRTLNILYGITQGCWILSPKWISDSYEAGYWLAEEDYEMFKEFPAAKVSRLNRQRYGKNYCCRLFAKIPRIYLAEVTSPPHEEIMKLLISCGGQLTNAVRKAGLAIGLINCRRHENLKIVSEKWILDEQFNWGTIFSTAFEYWWTSMSNLLDAILHRLEIESLK